MAGNLVVIGGNEDKRGECRVLREFVSLARSGEAGGGERPVVVMTAAADEPHRIGMDYAGVFARLGAPRVAPLHLASRCDAERPENAELVRRAAGVFFTGGDQIQITSLLGGTAVYQALHSCYAAGTVVAGTSAGAAAMSSTMIVGGEEDEPPRRSALSMAPGMGLIREVVIDQHFAQRGRIGRLLAAVAYNPAILGIGVDEDTAVVVEPDATFRVVGSGTVTVLDGSSVGDTNVSESSPTAGLFITGVRVHVLPAGYRFDLKARQPEAPARADRRTAAERSRPGGE